MNSSSNSLLEAKCIGREHRDGTGWLLRSVSFSVGAGERLVLTGPTGSGKTVLLRALAWLDAIDEGELLWRDKPLESSAIPAFRAEAMYLLQRPSLFSGTVEENLMLPFSLNVHRDREYSRDRILNQLQLLSRDEKFLAIEASNLSGGETQIVALLRAIQLEPSLLLLDEPTASLDETTTRQIELLVHDWHSAVNTDRAFVWVTHDGAQANRVADRTLQLRHGELIESGVGP